jgi:DNA-binding response OmpR family regulator
VRRFYYLQINHFSILQRVKGDGMERKAHRKTRDEIQLLVTDVLMPKKNGNELYEEIKRMKSSIKVIFTSSHSTEITKKLKRGSLAYLQKPYSPEKLLEKIRELLDEKKEVAVGKILHRLRKGYHSSFKSHFILPVLIASSILCTSCEKQPKVTGPPKKITIAYSTAANAILVYIAFAKGYFAEEGLDATPQPYL